MIHLVEVKGHAGERHSLSELEYLLVPLPAQQPDKALAARVQRLEDIEAIRTVLLDYGQASSTPAISRRTPGCSPRMGSGWADSAPCRVRRRFRPSWKKQIAGPNRGNTFHILSNFEIDVHGDTATAWSRWTFVTPGADKKPVIAQAGRYDDTFIRRKRPLEIRAGWPRTTYLGSPSRDLQIRELRAGEASQGIGGHQYGPPLYPRYGASSRRKKLHHGMDSRRYLDFRQPLYPKDSMELERFVANLGNVGYVAVWPWRPRIDYCLDCCNLAMSRCALFLVRDWTLTAGNTGNGGGGHAG